MNISVLAPLLLAVDMLWLQADVAGFGKMVRGIQGSDLEIDPLAGAMAYGMLLAGYAALVGDDPTFIRGMAYGAAVYGVFDLTNLAIFKAYSWRTALIDTLWGAALFGLLAIVDASHLKTRRLY